MSSSNIGSSTKKAILAAGGRSALAARLGVTYEAVRQWEAKGRIPVQRVADVELASGVSRAELRPDVFEAAAA